MIRRVEVSLLHSIININFVLSPQRKNNYYVPLTLAIFSPPSTLSSLSQDLVNCLITNQLPTLTTSQLGTLTGPLLMLVEIEIMFPCCLREVGIELGIIS